MSQKSEHNDVTLGTWLTTVEACRVSGLSPRTLQRRANQGSIRSKKESGRRLYHADDLGKTSPNVGTVTQSAEGGLLEQLREENTFLRGELQAMREQLSSNEKTADADRERQQTIILQLTRQTGDQQRLLEYHAEPWYKRILRRKRQPDGGPTP